MTSRATSGAQNQMTSRNLKENARRLAAPKTAHRQQMSMMLSKEIRLTRGFSTLVDSEDFERLSVYSWRVLQCGNNVYAINGQNILMHRLILQCDQALDVDHINGDGLDNRKNNLRVATRRQNLQNKRKNQNASSQYKGVTWDKRRRKWKGQIMLNGVNIDLGRHEHEVTAAACYDVAARKYFGPFARTNFPPKSPTNSGR